MFSEDKIKGLTELTDVLVLAEADSTNTFLKRVATQKKEGALVIAERQTSGRGRLGRTFVSEKNGLYMSLFLKPEFDDVTLITTMAAVAVAQAVDEFTGKKSKIKWVNDIYLDDLKVCGILTEGVFDGNKLIGAILGIGVNLFKPQGGMDKSIKNIAGYLFEEDNGLANEFLCAIINNFMKIYKEMEYIDEYRRRSYLDGKNVSFVKDREYSGTVIGIDDDFGLKVNCDGEIMILKCGEVSVKTSKS